MLEIQASTFRPDVWRCFYDLVDTEFPSGWGIDMWYHDYCIESKRVTNASMAVIDTMYVQHNPYQLKSTHHTQDIALQAENWKEFHNVHLKETRPYKDMGKVFYFPVQ